MRIQISGSIVTALHEDEYAVGSIVFVGPLAFINEDEHEEVDHHFWPEMRTAVRQKLWREKWRIGFFCGRRIFKFAEWLSGWRIRARKADTTPPRTEDR